MDTAIETAEEKRRKGEKEKRREGFPLFPSSPFLLFRPV